MQPVDFLRLVLPDVGFLILAEPLRFTSGEGKEVSTFKHHVVPDVEAVVVRAQELLFAQKDVYYALASYKEEKAWNPNAKNYKTGQLGKFETRTQANCMALKSLFLDFDIDPEPVGRKVDVTYPSKPEALRALIAFCEQLKLPLPLLVDSGGGVHAYWPLTDAVSPEEWMDTAAKFKAACAQFKLRIDPTVPADSARVLRVPGTANFKRGAMRPVRILTPGATASYTLAMLDALLSSYVTTEVYVPRRGAPAPNTGFLPNNLAPKFEASDFNMVAFHCAQVGSMCACRGADTPYNLWRLSLGVAKFTADPAAAAAALSSGHPQYDPVETEIKMDDWRTGPTTCEYFAAENSKLCEGCPHRAKITSPVQLGRGLKPAAAPTVEPAHAPEPTPTPAAAPAAQGVGGLGFTSDMFGDIAASAGPKQIELPDPPFPYFRADGRVIRQEENEKDGTTEDKVVCNNDLYPIRVLRQTGADAEISERSVWRLTLDRIGAVEIFIRQDLLSDAKKLHAELLANGMYVTPTQAKEVQLYMSAYLRQFTSVVDREQLYERMGWHEHRTAFVLGDIVLHRDGKQITHELLGSAKLSTDEAIDTNGTLDGWKETIKFFADETYAGHRFFLYAAFGSPLFHMTGLRGAMLTASGESGRGKTTCLEACASIWGNPERMVVNGNKMGTTINALYHKLGAYHSLPFLWDDTTERGGDEIREFLLNISQGKGKVRMHGADITKKPVEWETLVLSATNADDVMRIMGSGRNSDPHLMRLINVEFSLVDPGTEAKIRADGFRRDLRMHYGEAGIEYMRYIVQNYDSIQSLVTQAMAAIDRRLMATAEERYWTAVLACCLVGASVARKLGLITFNVEKDVEWMVEHISKLRDARNVVKNTALEIISEFLEAHVSNTLALSVKSTYNIDCVAIHPHGELHIRHEIDSNLIFVSRSEMLNYCGEHAINITSLEDKLRDEGVLLDHRRKITLGKDTKYAKGQVRCWVLDGTKLGDLPVIPPKDNVVPIGKAAANG